MRFTVYGTPIPKGSTKAFMRPGMRHPVVTHDNAQTKPWQHAIVEAALAAMQHPPLNAIPPFEGAVWLELDFYLPRPKSAPRRVTQPLKKPDLDKLVRCVKDGLTRAGVYRDDSQVVRLTARKEFAGGERDVSSGVPRVEVHALPLECLEMA